MAASGAQRLPAAAFDATPAATPSCTTTQSIFDMDEPINPVNNMFSGMTVGTDILSSKIAPGSSLFSGMLLGGNSPTAGGDPSDMFSGMSLSPQPASAMTATQPPTTSDPLADFFGEPTAPASQDVPGILFGGSQTDNFDPLMSLSAPSHQPTSNQCIQPSPAPQTSRPPLLSFNQGPVAPVMTGANAFNLAFQPAADSRVRLSSGGSTAFSGTNGSNNGMYSGAASGTAHSSVFNPSLQPRERQNSGASGASAQRQTGKVSGKSFGFMKSADAFSFVADEVDKNRGGK